jgi:hypothetical protein
MAGPLPFPLPPEPEPEPTTAARLPDFELPDPEAPETTPPRKPTKEALLAMKEQRTRYWAGRNEEIERDLALYLLNNAYDVKTTGKGGEEVLIRVTPRAMVDKLANMAGRQRNRVRCLPRAEAREYVDAAQAVEDVLVEHRRQLDIKHASRMLPNNYAYAQAWFLAATGWSASRSYLEAGRRWPVCCELFDPRCCYPMPADDDLAQLGDMLYVEKTTWGQFRRTNPRLATHRAFDMPDGQERDEAATVDVLWYEDRHWSVLLVDDGEPVHREHGYGFCPWTMIPCGGSPLVDEASRRHHGAGVIRALRHILAYQSRLLSQIATVNARGANPPYIMSYDASKGGKPKEIDWTPGMPTFLDVSKGEKVEFLQPLERPDLYEYLQRISDEDVDMAGVPDILRRTNAGPASGFYWNLLRSNAEDVLQPLTRAIVTQREWENRLFLQLLLVAERDKLLDPRTVSQVGEAPQQGLVYRRPNRSPGARAVASQAPKTVYAVLAPESIHLHGTDNEVILANMTPQDYAQMGQVAATLAHSGILSEKKAHEEVLGFDDYEGDQKQQIYEAFMKQPEVVQELSGPMVLEELDPEAAAWWERRQEQKRAQEAAAAAAQAAMQPPMPPPGMPPPGMPPGPGAAPLPGMGLDSTVLPPPMQPGTGVPGAGDEQALAALLAAGVIGPGLP